VADEMAAHGAGASSFSDWWAYKFEVYDAVPYNGAILHQRGVVTSYNSDSAELARRLNLEAAKAVRYGGVPETEALQFVTANPAKQLHVDRWVGSLEAGKDADFVIWSDSPLASTTHCEQTWIDGRRYFDYETDRAARAGMEAERNRLVEAARRARQSTKLEEKDETPSWRPIYWLEDAESCHEGEEP
jgi:N-acetylglucosamine-6-phosphate deacetylase